MLLHKPVMFCANIVSIIC